MNDMAQPLKFINLVGHSGFFKRFIIELARAVLILPVSLASSRGSVPIIKKAIITVMNMPRSSR